MEKELKDVDVIARHTCFARGDGKLEDVLKAVKCLQIIQLCYESKEKNLLPDSLNVVFMNILLLSINPMQRCLSLDVIWIQNSIPSPT